MSVGSTSELQAWRTNLAEALQKDAFASARQDARRRFSPELSYGRHFGPPRPETKMAAVMILIEPNPACGWSIPLTVRPKHLPDHPGQICFPGGRLEGEESFAEAAEREFMEELGPPKLQAEVIGELQPIYVFNSDYYVRPFVALSQHSHSYQPCNYEVARVVQLPLPVLCDPESHVQCDYDRGSMRWKALAIQVGEDQIWGATAIMLGELGAVLGGLGLPAST